MNANGVYFDQVVRYRQMQKKFRRACSQVVLLNNRIQDVQLRYDRAVKENKRSWRYVTRLNLATMEGVRNMFYEYACRRADELDRMQDALTEIGLLNVEDNTTDDDDDDDHEEEDDIQEDESNDGIDLEERLLQQNEESEELEGERRNFAQDDSIHERMQTVAENRERVNPTRRDSINDLLQPSRRNQNNR